MMQEPRKVYSRAFKLEAIRLAEQSGRPVIQLTVSAGGYYAWRQRPESSRSLRHRHLTEKIRESFEASDQTYGTVRICHDLREAKERGGKNTVALLMRRNHLVPRPVRRFWVTTDF